MDVDNFTPCRCGITDWINYGEYAQCQACGAIMDFCPETDYEEDYNEDDEDSDYEDEDEDEDDEDSDYEDEDEDEDDDYLDW